MWKFTNIFAALILQEIECCESKTPNTFPHWSITYKNLHFLFIFAHTLLMIVWWPFLTCFDVKYVFYKTVRALFFMSNLRRFLSIFSPWIKCQICHRHENTLELNTKSSELDTLHVLDPFETVSRSYLNYFAAPNIQTPDVMKRKRLFLSSFGRSKSPQQQLNVIFAKHSSKFYKEIIWKNGILHT